MFENCNLYIDCDEKNKNYSAEQLFRILITVDENGCPALRTLAEVSGGGGSGDPGNPNLINATDTNGTMTGYKSVTFSFLDPVVIDGVLISEDHSPITFSDPNGLADIDYDAREVTTGVVGGSELFIVEILE